MDMHLFLNCESTPSWHLTQDTRLITSGREIVNMSTISNILFFLEIHFIANTRKLFLWLFLILFK